MTEIDQSQQPCNSPPSDKKCAQPSAFQRACQFLAFNHILQKFFLLLFSVTVFGVVYSRAKFGREALAYFGILLMVVMTYIEMLVIRDHLWVLEGTLPEARRWRDHFFSGPALRQQRLRKFLVVAFTFIVFTHQYHYNAGVGIFSFVGVVLLVTVLYFEVLTLRDEVRTIADALKAREVEDALLLRLHKNLELQGAPINSGDDVSQQDDD